MPSTTTLTRSPPSHERPEPSARVAQRHGRGIATGPDPLPHPAGAARAGTELAEPVARLERDAKAAQLAHPGRQELLVEDRPHLVPGELPRAGRPVERARVPATH